MEQDPTLPNQTADPQKSLVTKLINHYEPNVDVTDDYYKSISEKYQDVDTLITKLVNHYEPNSEVTTDYLNGLYSKYGVKKKEQTEPTQTVQTQQAPTQAAPLPGLGGVSEEPTPSPSVGQGVLRDVDQTQPRGEAFIQGASDLTRTDVKQPQVDGEELPTGSTGPTGATGADGQGDIVPDIDYETMGIGETPTGAPISMDDPYIRQQDELRSQARDNNYQFGIDEPDESLPNYTAVGIPENVKDVDVKDYLSDQIGEVQRRVNQVMSNPEAYGFPQRILSATEEDIQELTNQIYKQSAPASTYNRGRGGLIPLPIENQGEDFINLDESYFRNVVKNAVNNYKSRYEVDKNDRILKEITSDYIQAGYEKEKIRGVIFGELSNQEKFDDEEKKLYDINNQLRTLRGQLSSLTPDSPKYSEVQQKYNGLILSADDARKKLGDDREALYDTRTGERVDKIDSPNASDLTLQIQDEMEQLTFEEDVQDVYVKAGLADNEHKSYGQKTKFDIEIPLTRTGKTDMLMHRQAIDGLKMLGYQSSPVLDEDGNQTNRMSFKDVSLSDISNSYVREAVRRTNESLAENAERWHDRNVDLMVKRIAARNMSLLNIDPGKVKREQFSAFGIDFYPARMLEVIGEEVLPKGMTEEIGISDVKLVDNAIPQLEAHGIELTESQKENAERSLGLEVQEGVASFIPMIVELAVLNKAAGAAKVVTGLNKILEGYRAGNKFERGLAIAIDALIEEGQMQIAGMNTGAGASFSVMGNRLRKYGLDKFPLRFKGELARLNKLGDNVWSNSMTGVVTMEFASNVEAAIEDFMGGETMQNHIEQNYSDLSEVGKRGLVNTFVFNIIGLRGLIGKGKSGFSIRRMEEASAELKQKGHTEEAKQLDSYIKEYYETGGGFEKQMTKEELREYRKEASQLGYREDLESLEEWIKENPEKHKQIVKGKADVYFRYTLGEKLRPYFPKILKKVEGKFLTDPTVVDRIQKPYTRVDLKESDAKKPVYEVKLLGSGGKEIDSYEAESKEEAEAVSNEINTDLKEKESVVETAPAVTEPTGDIVPAKQKGRLTKFSTPQDGIVGEVTYEDGTKKELTQEKYDALEKQEGLFDVETGTQPVAETVPTEVVAEEAAPTETPTEVVAEKVEEVSEQEVVEPTDEVTEEVTVKKKDEVQTGKPLKIRYNKNPQKAPDMGAEFGQDVEASGDYVTQKVSDFTPEGFEAGVVESENPLVIDITDDTQISYKNELSQRYDGKVGEELSEAIRQDGYDAIVTKYDDGSTGEIVLLKGQRDAIQEQEAADVPKAEQPEAVQEVEGEVREPTKEEVLSEEDAKSEEKVKEFVEKNLSDEKKNEEADKEIESKSEEELKEDVPDVLESISESERERLDREAKFKKKSTVDYVIDYLKGKLKNVRQSIKNILEKLRSNYRKSLIATAIVAELFGGVAKAKIAYEYLNGKEIIEAYETGGKEAAAIKFAEENPEIFKSSLGILKYTDASPKFAGRLANVGIKAGVIEPVKLEYKESDYQKEDGITKGYFDRKTKDEIIEVVEDRNGLDIASTRNTFPAARGIEVVLQGNNSERKSSGKNKIDDVKYVMHYGLDDNVLSGKRHKDTPAIHRRSIEIDGFVPYVIKRVGDRVVYTYKRYSEVADISKPLSEVLKDKKILDPLRQYNYDDIQWDKEPNFKRPDSVSLTDGDRVYAGAVELLLKDGVENVYRKGITKHDSDDPANKQGTYIMYTYIKSDSLKGKENYGRYNGGSFALIFNDKDGNRFVRNFTGSVEGLKKEGQSVAKEFDIPTSEITVAFHDAGSVSGKPVAIDGAISERENNMVNDHNPNATFGYLVPVENEILTKTADPISGERETPIGLMALPLLFGGARRKRKALENADSDKVVTEWMEDVQQIYDAQKTKNKREARDQAAVNLALSGKLDNLAPDQVKAVLEGIQTETGAMGKKWSVSTVSELDGLTIKQQFKQGFEEYVAALKDKEASKKIKAEIKLQEKIDKLKEKAKEAVQKTKDDVAARKVFNEIMNAEMKELGLGELRQSEIKNLLSMAKQADRKKIEDLIERGINLMAKAAKKNLKTGAEQVRKKLSDRIKKGDFGTADQKAIAIANIPVENIPVKRLPEYYDLLGNLVSKRGKISAVDLNKASDFIDSISEEIENKIGGVETLAELYDVFDSERKIESESEEYIEAKKLKKDERNARQQGLINRIEGKAKEEFKSFLEELGMPTEITDFANNEFEAIVKEHKRQNTEKGKPLTSAKKIEKIKEKRQQAIDNFNSLYPIEKGSRGIDISLYKNNEVLAEAAAFFNKLGNNQLKDLLPSEINALPLIYENMNFGLMTSSVFRIMSKIKGSMTVDQMSESSSQFSRMLATSPKDLPGDVKTMAEDFTLPLYNLVKPETPTSVSIKDAKELGRRMLAEQTPYIKYLMKGIKGDPVYEMLNGLTGAMTSASSMVSDAKRKTYDLFMGMKGLPLENNMMISTFHRIREHQGLKGETDIAIRRPIEYVDAKIETARTDNQGIYDLMVGIKDKYFDKNGDPKIDKLTGESLIEKEINKRGGKELVDFMDKMNEVTREMGRTIAVIRGIPYKEIDLYGASRAEHGTDNLSEKMSKITAGKTLSSVKSGAVLSRTGNTKKTFDSVGDFLSSFDNTVHEYYLTEPLSTISNFVSIANKTGNVNLARYANAIKDYVSGSIENQIKTNYSDGGFWMNLMNDIISTRKSGAVFGLGVKPFAETFSQMNKILLIPEARKSFMTGIQVLKESGDGVLNFQKAFEFMRAIQSTHQNRAGVLNAEVYYQPGYFERKLKSNTGRYLNIYNKVRPLLKPTKGMKRGLQRAAEISQMAPDAFGVIQVNIGAFAEKFKELTGKYPDINKIIEDKQYRAENADAIRKARAYADKLTSSTAAPSSMAEVSKAGYLLPPFRMGYIKKEPGTKSQNLFILDTYSSSEKRTLLTNLKELRDSLMKPFIARGMSESWTGSEKKTFDVLQEITGRNVAGISYQIYRLLGFAALNTLIQMLEKELFGTDEEELDLSEEFEKGAKKGILDQALLPLLGNASWVTRLMLLGGIYVAAKYTEGELDEDEESYSEEFKKSVYLPDLNRYGNIPVTVSKFGFEGQVAADALELSMMLEILTEDQSISSADIGKFAFLLSRNAAPTPQEALRLMRLPRTMQKVEKANKLINGINSSFIVDEKTRAIYNTYIDLDNDKSALPLDIRDTESINVDGVSVKYEIDKDDLMGLYFERGKLINGLMTPETLSKFRTTSDPKKRKDILKSIYKEVNNLEDYQLLKDAYFLKNGKRVN